jgi:hypothetical protein
MRILGKRASNDDRSQRAGAPRINGAVRAVDELKIGDE